MTVRQTIPSGVATAELSALRRAAREALELARRTKTPCHVLQDGKVVDIAAPGQVTRGADLRNTKARRKKQSHKRGN